MAAITYNIKNKKIVIDPGILYVITIFVNLLVLNVLFFNLHNNLFNSIIHLLIVCSFFNSIFIKLYFDSLYTKSKNLLFFSIFFFLVSMFISPIIIIFLHSIKIFDQILFLFIISIFINIISPFWSAKKYLWIFFISIIVLFLILFLKLDSIFYIIFFIIVFLILFVCEVLQFNFKNKFEIYKYYIFETLILAVNNFVINFLLFDPIIRYKVNILYLIIINISFVYLFKLYLDTEKYSWNLLKGKYEIIKNKIKKIINISKTYLHLNVISQLLIIIIFSILDQNNVFWTIYFSIIALFIYIIKVNEFFNKIENIIFLGILLFLYLQNNLALVLIGALIFSILIYFRYFHKKIDYEELIKNLFYYYLEHLFRR